MRSLGVDANNDLVLVGGTLPVLTGTDAVLAVCAACARAILGEMVLATGQGMPYFETVWIGGPTVAPFEAAFRARVLQIEGVTAIEELTVSQENNTMRYSATISTVYGTGSLSG